jgi:hypothetical protein
MQPGSSGGAWIGLLGLAAVAGCAPSKPAAVRLGEPAPVSLPAAAGSRYPHLSGLTGGPVVVSWLEPTGMDAHELRFATWRSGAWSAPRVAAQGAGWFVNWADFPSVVPVSADFWGAHWLQQASAAGYAYDVRTSTSVDGGTTWSTPDSPHDDGTPTEHGFVTLLGHGGQLHAVWLDGRRTAGGHGSGSGSDAMTLRHAVVARDGRRAGSDEEVDERVCDCCQTDAAATDEGIAVVYRDRDADEIRDIALVRLGDEGWSDPVHVHDDGWKIDACPVNGPAIDASGRHVVVAWFTAPDTPRVRVAFSADGGRTFSAPVEVDQGRTAGRVDVVLLEDELAAVSWLAEGDRGGEIRVRALTPDGPAGAAIVVAASSVGRSSGFPQMLRVDGGLLFAWTESGGEARVRTAFAPLL